MNLLDRRSLKQKAAETLRLEPGFQKLVLLHCAVSIGILFVLTAVGLLLDRAIEGHQGLSGMGTVGILQTVQSTLSTGVNLLLPFWEIGILHVAMRVYRRQDASFPMLRQGFLRFGPVLRHYLLLMALYFGVAMLCMNLLLPVTAMVPLPQSVVEMIKQLDMTAPDAMEQFAAMLPNLPQKEMLPYTVGIMVIFLVPYLAVLIHLSYRFRFSQYLLVDDHPARATVALTHSNRLTKGNKWNLFKLDLSFWWYYLLQFTAAGVTFVPDLLRLAGVSLPLSSDVLYLCCYGIYSLATLALTWYAGAYVQLTYAAALEQLRTPPEQFEA